MSIGIYDTHIPGDTASTVKVTHLGKLHALVVGLNIFINPFPLAICIYMALGQVGFKAERPHICTSNIKMSVMRASLDAYMRSGALRPCDHFDSQSQQSNACLPTFRAFKGLGSDNGKGLSKGKQE